jgi:hypothetical protein
MSAGQGRSHNRFKDSDLDAILRATDGILHTASDGKLGQSAQ